MDEITVNNYCLLRGRMTEVPRYSHSARGEDFYHFPLEISRLSGTTDIINIISRSSLLDDIEVKKNCNLCIEGTLRSFNNKSGAGPKLVITVFAKEMYFEPGDDENIIELRGTICKPPSFRATPMGREICDLMLAVNRPYGRSDYLPCITWGLKAREAAQWSVGTSVILNGRIQSRNYTKIINGEYFEKTAYEVSVINICKDT
ncbi:MAG: single-stranded DNA-binding protein [Ruminococcaceae bacterium]|nr:single-stranded DNA-binding protein [Oscillospiraceae bacterium]